MKTGSLWRRPGLRSQEHEEGERHATWLELFYDLIFVVAVASMAGKLNDDIVHNLPGFVFLFIPVWWTWCGTTFYSTRFDTDDIGHRLITLIQMVAVVAMAVNVHEGLGATSAAFALSYFAVRSILVLQYIYAGKMVPLARSLTLRYSKGFGAACLLWLLSCCAPVPWRFAIWIAALVIDFLTPLLAGKLHSDVKPHLMHLPERFGLFIIIVLGESVADVVRSLTHNAWSTYSVLSGMLGLFIPFSLWWLYFDNMEHISLRDALSRGKIYAYNIWLYSHLPLAMGITALAVALEKVLSHSGSAPLPAGLIWFLCGSVSVTLASIGVLCAASFIITECQGSGIKPHYFLIAVAMIILSGIAGLWLAPTLLVALIAIACAIPIVSHIRDVMRSDGEGEAAKPLEIAD
jgi:low temperature requirement protein LtrA